MKVQDRRASMPTRPARAARKPVQENPLRWMGEQVNKAAGMAQRATSAVMRHAKALAAPAAQRLSEAPLNQDAQRTVRAVIRIPKAPRQIPLPLRPERKPAPEILKPPRVIASPFRPEPKLAPEAIKLPEVAHPASLASGASQCPAPRSVPAPWSTAVRPGNPQQDAPGGSGGAIFKGQLPNLPKLERERPPEKLKDPSARVHPLGLAPVANQDAALGPAHSPLSTAGRRGNPL